MNGCKSDVDKGESSEGDMDRELCLKIVRGLMDARRGLKTRGDGISESSSSDADGVLGRPLCSEKGLELSESYIEGAGDMDPKPHEDGVGMGGCGNL